MNSSVGNYIGKYEIIRLLGRGGMAEVYEAFQPGTERSVAIKVLQGHGNETPESVARFKREARSIAQLRHTNIVQVFDFDVDREVLYYMVMEYIRGVTLDQLIHRNGRVGAPRVARLLVVSNQNRALHEGLVIAAALSVVRDDGAPFGMLLLVVPGRGVG